MPVRLNSTGGGSVTLDVPAVGTNTTLNLPTANGTLLASDGSGNVTVSGTATFSGNATFNAGLIPSSSFLRNRIINGDMRIDQRNAGASVTPTGAAYTLDRWLLNTNLSSRVSIQRSSIAPTGFTNSLLVTSLSAYTPVTTNACAIEQYVEGFNWSDVAWGTASAMTVTLSFWVRSSLTGTFSIRIEGGSGRNYVATYAVNAVNTWEYKTVTIPGDTSGTWDTTNGVGVGVWFDLGSGPTYNGSAGAWTSSTIVKTSGSTNIIATNGATFYLTGVQLEVGSVATPFERRQFGQELALCQRYFQFMTQGVAGGAVASSIVYLNYQPPVTFRALPTLSLTAAARVDWPYNANYTQGSPTDIVYSFPAINGGIGVVLFNFSGLTVNSHLTLRDDGGRILLSAEL